MDVHGGAEVKGPVHFIYLGGEFTWQHWRAVETARHLNSHALPIIWSIDENLQHGFYPHHVDVRPLRVPAWLTEHPIQLANVKDYYAYRILREHGGMYLDFDTITLRPAWDLLTADVCMSTEFPPGDEGGEPFNTAVVLAKQGAPILLELEMEAYRLLTDGEDTWGALGPHLISRIARANPTPFSPAPYRALNGWSYHSIQNYYDDPRDPGEDVRVIHLYSSSYRTQFENDRWTP